MFLSVFVYPDNVRADVLWLWTGFEGGMRRLAGERPIPQGGDQKRPRLRGAGEQWSSAFRFF